MNVLTILPIITFALVMSITPGPNNILLTASGAVFGFKKTIPHILGIIFGIGCLNTLSAVGLHKLFSLFPYLKEILKYLGVAYMLYLSIKIAISSKIKEKKCRKPFSFIQGAIFQVLNPKAVLMSLTAMSVYTKVKPFYIQSVITIIVIFIFIGLPSISIWAYFGSYIGNLLKKESNAKLFNYIMGLATAFSGIILLF